MKAKTENPFRSADRKFFLVMLPMVVAFVVIVAALVSGFAPYEFTETGSLIRIVVVR